MERKLVECLVDSGTYEFYFKGYEEFNDFLKIVAIIKNTIKPEKLNYSGLEDVSGYFVKDGVQINMLFDMTGNEMIYNNKGYKNDIKKVRKWISEIWNELQ